MRPPSPECWAAAACGSSSPGSSAASAPDAQRSCKQVYQHHTKRVAFRARALVLSSLLFSSLFFSLIWQLDDYSSVRPKWLGFRASSICSASSVVSGPVVTFSPSVRSRYLQEAGELWLFHKCAAVTLVDPASTYMKRTLIFDSGWCTLLKCFTRVGRLLNCPWFRHPRHCWGEGEKEEEE